MADHAPPTLDRGARRRARTRIAILDAAERAFAGHGLRSARVEDIAEAADVAVGSIYGHFGSKDGMYLALVERSLELFQSYMQTAYDPALRPIEQVIAGGDAYLRFHLEHPGFFRFLAFPGIELPPDFGDEETRERIATQLEALTDEFAAVIARAIEAGEAIPVDARHTTMFLWGAWNGVVALSTRPDRTALTDDEVAATLDLGRRIVLNGLASSELRGPDGQVLDDVRVVTVPSPPSDQP